MPGRSYRGFRSAAIAALGLFVSALPVQGQVSFTSAISQSLRNSPRVKLAEDDLNHAAAALSEIRDFYIPSFGASGGLGRSYGITLTVPTIFTLNAQSLIFSYSQKNYIRAARENLKASTETLQDVREQVEEDAAITYVSLVEAEMRLAAVSEEYSFALRIVAITEDRVNAGMESSLELQRARRTEVQTRLAQLQIDDEIATLREHLGQLTGLEAGSIVAMPDTVPANSSFPAAGPLPRLDPEAPSLLSAEANARSRLQQAFGDARYTMRPQLSFFAQYGRISPINNVSEYYNLNGRYNTFSAGVQIGLPFIDRVRSAKARETMIDAVHAQHDTEVLRGQIAEGRSKLRHAILELGARAELADIEQSIAQEQLKALLLEVKTRSEDVTGRQLTPKDEQFSRLEERQSYVNVLDAVLQLRKANISLLRQTGGLEHWLNSLPQQ